MVRGRWATKLFICVLAAAGVTGTVGGVKLLVGPTHMPLTPTRGVVAAEVHSLRSLCIDYEPRPRAHRRTYHPPSNGW